MSQPGLWSAGGSAVLSPDGVYRYELRRSWNPRPACGWIMLNPSRADATDDDPTVRRCLGFASAWGYGSLLIHNLYVFSVGRGCGRLTTGLLRGVEPSACVAHGCVRRSRKLTTGNAPTPGRAPADDSAVGPEPQHLHDPG